MSERPAYDVHLIGDDFRMACGAIGGAGMGNYVFTARKCWISRSRAKNQHSEGAANDASGRTGVRRFAGGRVR